jgi:hypothetical protein
MNGNTICAKLRWRSIPAPLILVLIAWGYSRGANRIGPRAEQEALEIGVEAYIYGYPLVTMEMTRRVMTNVDAPLETKAPMRGSSRTSGTIPTRRLRTSLPRMRTDSTQPLGWTSPKRPMSCTYRTKLADIT